MLLKKMNKLRGNRPMMMTMEKKIFDFNLYKFN